MTWEEYKRKKYTLHLTVDEFHDLYHGYSHQEYPSMTYFSVHDSLSKKLAAVQQQMDEDLLAAQDDERCKQSIKAILDREGQ